MLCIYVHENLIVNYKFWPLFYALVMKFCYVFDIKSWNAKGFQRGLLNVLFYFLIFHYNKNNLKLKPINKPVFVCTDKVLKGCVCF